jgi:predicted Zn-dependent peptidase
MPISRRSNLLFGKPSLKFYGLGLDYFGKYQENIQSVSKQDVLILAQKHLHPDKYVPVIVANLKEMGSDKI